MTLRLLHRRGLLLALLAVIPLTSWSQEHTNVRVPTTFHENGVPVSLELIVVRPQGTGPFPTIVFNHGSTGRGDNPARAKQTFSPGIVTRFFAERGWMVLYPQRRGRGRSDGIYDEGFDPDRSAYSCLPRHSLPGLERALDDLDALLVYARTMPDIDQKLLVVGGVSRGGIASIAHAARHPDAYAGVINFVGGWVGEDCPAVRSINTSTFEKAARYPRETIWLYGENDAFYSMRHSRSNFSAFVSAGGKGTFHAFDLGPGNRGHLLLSNPGLWGEAVARYLAQIQAMR